MPARLQVSGFNNWVNAARIHDVAIALFAILTIVVVKKITDNQERRNLKVLSLERRAEEHPVTS